MGRLLQGTKVYFQGSTDWDKGFPIVYNIMKCVATPLQGVEPFSFSYADHSNPALYKSLQSRAEKKVYFLFRSSVKLHNQKRRSLLYSLIFCFETKIWTLFCDLDLESGNFYLAQTDADFIHKKFAFQEFVDFYNLIKYLHLALDCSLTMASRDSEYFDFGYTDDDPLVPSGADEALRFDKFGMCRLARPFEDEINPYPEEGEYPYEDLENPDFIYSKTSLPIKVSDYFFEKFDLPLPHLIPQTLPDTKE